MTARLLPALYAICVYALLAAWLLPTLTQLEKVAR